MPILLLHMLSPCQFFWCFLLKVRPCLLASSCLVLTRCKADTVQEEQDEGKSREEECWVFWAWFKRKKRKMKVLCLFAFALLCFA